MATEGPTMHDGGQCVAGVNMSSSAGLVGWNGTGQFLLVKISGSRQVAPVAAATDFIYGVLQNDPIAGYVADVLIFGVTKCINGVAGALAAGTPVMADTSGRCIVATTGNQACGIIIDGGATQNQVCTMKFVGTTKF